MRRGIVVLASLLLTVRSSLRTASAGDDPPGGPPPPKESGEKPRAPEEAALAVLGAVREKDERTLATLAAKDAPDPWRVADELLARGEPDAALAFARAAPRRDVERLPEYVESRRGVVEDARRRALASGHAALAARRLQEALDAFGPSPPTAPEDVVGVRLETGRGQALRALHRLAEAASAFGRAAEGALALGWHGGAAATLFESGSSALARSDYPGATAAYERMLRVEEARGRTAGVASALVGLGNVQISLARWEDALERYEEARRLWESVGDRAGLANAIGGVALAHQLGGNVAEALEHHARALALKQALGDRAGVARTLGHLGVLHYGRSDHALALEHHERSLALAEDLGDLSLAADALGNIALVHEALGRYAKAIEFHERSLALERTTGDRLGVAKSLGNLGIVEEALGNTARALERHEASLRIKRELGDDVGAATTLTNLAGVYESLGDMEKALACYEEALAAKTKAKDRAGIAAVLGNSGNVHYALGDLGKALERYERSREIYEALGDRSNAAVMLGNVGNVHASLGDTAKAIEHLERGLRICREVGDRAGAARALGNLGNVQSSLGEHRRAIGLYELALAEAERCGARDAVFLGWKHLANARWSLGEHRQAADAAHRAVVEMAPLTRGLGDEAAASSRGQDRFVNLYEVGVGSAAAVGDVAETAFFLESARAGALLAALRDRAALRDAVLPAELREAVAGARRAEAEAVAALAEAEASREIASIRARRKDLDAARARVSAVFDRIQREARAGANLVHPVADPLSTIQARLAPGEALLLYGMFTRDAAALVVTRSAARLVPLGRTADVVSACTALSLATPAADPTASLSRLRDLVARPLALDETVVRAYVSPDGALSYVPFPLLLDGREVAHVPSGTTLGLLLEERRETGEGVLALGDPDYGGAAPAPPEAPTRAGARLVPLPATREEAKAVGDVTLLGKEASEAGLVAALSTRPRWRAVHLACHGRIDPERPWFSSLALSRSGEDDGFLTVHEVFRTKVPADLVVLSACETGKGKIAQGEGIVGLTRAFMFAGAPRVLVSLWKVDDAATRALMAKLYERWKAGTPTARALREAQEHVRADPRWRHPYYWGAWTLWGLAD
jgi:tetratricopeptide (TPR) repeat protein